MPGPVDDAFKLFWDDAVMPLVDEATKNNEASMDNLRAALKGAFYAGAACATEDRRHILNFNMLKLSEFTNDITHYATSERSKVSYN